jgi:SH3-like domain-containing protein
MRHLLILALSLALGTPALPQDVGPVTGLPLPRFVSLKSSSTNARRGPSLAHRVDWEFIRKGLPVRVTAEYENWRRIEDSEGAGGWVHYTLLSGTRTVIFVSESATLRDQPVPTGASVAIVEQGVVAEFGECAEGWCEVEAGGVDGWTEAANLWGLLDSESGTAGE